jgi:hypothetical protein
MRMTNLQSTQEAIDAARAAIDGYAPGFAANIYHFGNFSNDIITPFRQGPIGTLLDANPITARQTNPGKLNTFIATAPADVGANAGLLNDAAVTGGPTVNPLDIAAAMAQRGLGDGVTNPGAAMRGIFPEGTLDQLITAGGGDPAHVTAPLHAADNLQTFLPGAGNVEIPGMSPVQGLIRPARTMDMIFTGASQNARNQQIAALLARNDPQAISDLQQIGMFDPNVRKALMLKNMIIPTTALPQEEN